MERCAPLWCTISPKPQNCILTIALAVCDQQSSATDGISEGSGRQSPATCSYTSSDTSADVVAPDLKPRLQWLQRELDDTFQKDSQPVYKPEQLLFMPPAQQRENCRQCHHVAETSSPEAIIEDTQVFEDMANYLQHSHCPAPAPVARLETSATQEWSSFYNPVQQDPVQQTYWTGAAHGLLHP